MTVSRWGRGRVAGVVVGSIGKWGPGRKWVSGFDRGGGRGFVLETLWEIGKRWERSRVE